jgi:bifunctional DNA-binding transcriptional regulator/antitoxin component of YhaV-PrlF toxin-antitoxin module
MNVLEVTDNVEKWSSEQIVIPYRIRGELHMYHTDFTVILKDGRKFIIEIKPIDMVPMNESAIRRSPEMYKNACKWKAALEYAKKNGYIFKVVTEDGIKPSIFSSAAQNIS